MREFREYRKQPLRELTSQRLVVRIDKSGWRAEGLVRCLDGWISVRGAHLGETLEVETADRAHPGKLYATLTEVIESSDRRAETGCPHFGRCAGCQTRHMTRPDERQFKMDSILEILTKFSGFQEGDLPAPEWVANAEDGARRRGSLSRGRDEWGLRIPGAPDERVDMRHCPALMPEAQQVVRNIIEVAKAEGWEDEIEWSMGSDQTLLRTQSEISEEAAARLKRHRIAAISNGQTSTLEVTRAGLEMLESMDAWSHATRAPADALYDWVAPKIAGPRLLELGSGIGTISILAARNEIRVTAVDGERAAIAMAEQNARHHGVELDLRGASFEKACRDLAVARERFETTLINPMREPVGARVMRYVDRLTRERIIYLAPSPAAGARDIEVLRELGWERVCEWAAIDLHPGTYHVMMGLILERERPDSKTAEGARVYSSRKEQ